MRQLPAKQTVKGGKYVYKNGGNNSERTAEGI